VVHEVTTGF